MSAYLDWFKNVSLNVRFEVMLEELADLSK